MSVMRNAIRLIAVNVVVLAVLAELASLGWYYLSHGMLY